MNDQPPNETEMRAIVRLRNTARCIPESGLTARALRVELAPEEASQEAWFAVLEVTGDLPWRAGTERTVEVRIMSGDFAESVRRNLPDLLVRRGAETVGDLRFERGDQVATV